MSANECPELDLLFTELLEERDGPAVLHARGCDACSAVMEEHRQLEKDLFRLADPPPPPDFVQSVMAKVEQAPAPARVEVLSGVGIFIGALALFAGALVVSGGGVGVLGADVARAALRVRELLIGSSNLLDVLWSTATIPLVTIAVLALTGSLFALRRTTRDVDALSEVSA